MAAMSGRSYVGNRKTELEIAFAMLRIVLGRWGQVIMSKKLSILGLLRPDGSVTVSAWYKSRKVAAFRMTAAHKIENTGINAKEAEWWAILFRLASLRRLAIVLPEPTHPAPIMVQ
jgi:hypothetical protein